MNITDKVNYQNNVNSIITPADAERLFGWYNLIVSNDTAISKTFLGGLETFVRDNNIGLIKGSPFTFIEDEVRILIYETTNISLNLFNANINGTITNIPAMFEDKPLEIGNILPNKAYIANYVSADEMVYIKNISRPLGDDTDYTFWDKIIPWGDLQKGYIKRKSITVQAFKYLHISNGGSFRSMHFITTNTSTDTLLIIMNQEGKYTALTNGNVTFIKGDLKGDLNEMFIEFNCDVICRSIQFEKDSNIIMSLSEDDVGSETTPIQMLENNLVGRLLPDGTTIDLVSNSTTSPASVYNRVAKSGIGLETDFSYGVKYKSNTIEITGVDGVTTFVGINIYDYNNNVGLGIIENKYRGMISVDLQSKRKDSSDEYANSLGVTDDATPNTAITYKDTVVRNVGFVGVDDSTFNEINVTKTEDDIETDIIVSGLIKDGDTLEGCYLASFEDSEGNHVVSKVSRFTDKYRSTLNAFDYDLTSVDYEFSGDENTENFKIYGIEMGCNIRKIPRLMGISNNYEVRTGWMIGSDSSYNLGKSYSASGYATKCPEFDQYMTICYLTNGLLYSINAGGNDYQIVHKIGNNSGTTFALNGDGMFMMTDEDYEVGSLLLIVLTRISTTVYKQITNLALNTIDYVNATSVAITAPADSMFFSIGNGTICWTSGTSSDLIIEYSNNVQAIARIPNIIKHVEKGENENILIVDVHDYIWECGIGELSNKARYVGMLIRPNPDLNGYNPILNYTGIPTDVLNPANMGHRIDLKTSFCTNITDTRFARANIKHKI